jgi:hypothetical protein
MWFRTLSTEEEVAFRDWARKNYIPGDPIKSVWHPIVQAECKIMNRATDIEIWVLDDGEGERVDEVVALPTCPDPATLVSWAKSINNWHFEDQPATTEEVHRAFNEVVLTTTWGHEILKSLIIEKPSGFYWRERLEPEDREGFARDIERRRKSLEVSNG